MPDLRPGARAQARRHRGLQKPAEQWAALTVVPVSGPAIIVRSPKKLPRGSSALIQPSWLKMLSGFLQTRHGGSPPVALR